MTITRGWAGPAALTVAGLAWGSSFVWGKIALAEAGFVEVTLLRFVLAALVLAPYAWRHPVRRADVPMLLLIGVLMVPVTFLVQFAGLARTSASTAALIIGSLPALVAVGSLLTGARLGRRTGAAVVVSTAGVALCVGGAAGSDLVGNLLVLASMLAVVGWVLLGKRVLGRYEPVQAASWTTVLGTAVLVPVALVTSGPPTLAFSAQGWASVAALGLACSALTAVTWNVGLSRTSASGAGLFLNVEPLTGAVLGVLVLGEPLSAGLVIGGVLVLGAAAYVVARSDEPEEPGRVRTSSERMT